MRKIVLTDTGMLAPLEHLETGDAKGALSHYLMIFSAFEDLCIFRLSVLSLFAKVLKQPNACHLSVVKNGSSAVNAKSSSITEGPPHEEAQAQ